MTPQLELLRELPEAEDIGGFLSAYADYLASGQQEPTATNLTQRLPPPVLLRCLHGERLPAPALVQLYRLVASGRLLVVENEVLHAINLRVEQAMRLVETGVKLPVTPLRTFSDGAAPAPRPVRQPEDGDVMRVRRGTRVAVVSAFSFETWSVSDAFDFRKNLCASRQEGEFLQAVRQFLPNLQAYPNAPLRNFIDIDKLEERLPVRVRIRLVGAGRHAAVHPRRGPGRRHRAGLYPPR